MSLPKVFMIGWEFPPNNSGGLGTACKGLTSALSREEVYQTFVLPKQLPVNAPYVNMVSPSNPYFNQIHVNMEIHPYGPRTPRYSWYLNRNTSHYSYFTSMVNEAYMYSDVISEIAHENTHDLIHAHDWMTYPAAFAAKQVSGKPVVLHVHSTEYDRSNGSLNPEVAHIEADSLSRADRIITVSNYTKEIVAERYNIDKSKIDVVHNGIDLEDVQGNSFSSQELESFAKGKKIVIFMGRLTCQKGPDYFVRIAGQIAKSVPEALFVVAGDGDMYNQVVMQGAQYNLTGKLLYSGFLRDRERNFLYQRADLFVMPSVSEPFGIVALEAAAANTPVIISKQSGVSEVMKSAMVSNFWDTNRIANDAIKILTTPNYHAQLARAAANEVRNINWEHAAKKCVNIYNEMV